MIKNPVQSAFILGEYRFKVQKTIAQYPNKTKKASTCVNEIENKDAYFKLDKNGNFAQITGNRLIGNRVLLFGWFD